MFSKPYAGWCEFSHEDFRFSFSYVKNTPQDFIDAFIDTLNSHKPFCVTMDGEPTACVLVVDDFWILHIIVNESVTIGEEKSEAEDFTLRSYEIDLVDFAQEFVDDMEKYKDDFKYWQSFSDEECKEYDLGELKETLAKYRKDR